MKFISSLLFLLVAMTAHSQSLRYLALGDSYTIGESVPASERWPVLLADSLEDRGIPTEAPKIIATTGWRTDNLMNAIQIANLKQEYDLVSLLIGVNNQYQGKPIDQYRTEFKTLLEKAVWLAGGKKDRVFVLSIPDYWYTPFGQKKQAVISRELDEYNAICKSITDEAGIAYYNITDISRHGLEDSSLVAADGLHPSGKQYALWVGRIVTELAAGLK